MRPCIISANVALVLRNTHFVTNTSTFVNHQVIKCLLKLFNIQLLAHSEPTQDSATLEGTATIVSEEQVPVASEPKSRDVSCQADFSSISKETRTIATQTSFSKYKRSKGKTFMHLISICNSCYLVLYFDGKKRCLCIVGLIALQVLLAYSLSEVQLIDFLFRNTSQGKIQRCFSAGYQKIIAPCYINPKQAST